MRIRVLRMAMYYYASKLSSIACGTRCKHTVGQQRNHDQRDRDKGRHKSKSNDDESEYESNAKVRVHFNFFSHSTCLLMLN